ncbi:MAG: hypothetical protein J6P74_00515 [Paludibacteraceae bacterium]|nr:hypothetical protein [Paludibacteraceae bacterium]
MNDLSNIRNMRDLEHQRAILEKKAAIEERKVRQDINAVKADYTPIINGVNSIRNGFAKIRLIVPILLPIFRFFWNRRQNRKR